MIDLTVSIINHSNPELLRGCLDSLYRATKQITLDVWVVDNATDQRLVEEIRKEFPSVNWLFNPQRMGFSANHNQVIDRASGRYVCVLNDDTIIHDGALDSLVRYMDDNPRVGMSGPRLLNVDGSIQDSVFHFPTLSGYLFDVCYLPAFLCFLKGRHVNTLQIGNEPVQVDWILGACMVVRKEVIETIGGLDSALSPKVYMEEVDWCLRVHRAGWGISFVPDAVITHYGGQSTESAGAGNSPMRIELCRVMIAYERKHHGPIQATCLRLIYLFSVPWNVLVATQTWLRRRVNTDDYRRTVQTMGGIALAALGKPR